MTDDTDDTDGGIDTETIECAGCGDPLEVTAYTASVAENNTYHPRCFPDNADDGAWEALADNLSEWEGGES